MFSSKNREKVGKEIYKKKFGGGSNYIEIASLCLRPWKVALLRILKE